MPGVKRKRSTTNVSTKRARRVKRSFNIPRGRSKFGRTGYLRVVRWSNADGTNNCHVTLDNATLGSSGAFSTIFQFTHIAGNAELTSLFDNYRLLKVLYRWVCVRNPDYSVTSSGQFPRITWVHDFNDSAAITRNQMYQHAGMREHFFTESNMKTRWYSIRPASLGLKFETGTLTAYTPQWGSWVDTNDNQMAHYGIKYAFSELNSGMTIRMEAKFIMEFKGIS